MNSLHQVPNRMRMTLIINTFVPRLRGTCNLTKAYSRQVHSVERAIVRAKVKQ